MTLTEITCRLFDDDGLHPSFTISCDSDAAWIEAKTVRDDHPFCYAGKDMRIVAHCDHDSMIEFLKVAIAVVEMEKRRHNG